MPRVRIMANGIPFTVEGEGNPQQLAGALQERLTADPTLLEKRGKQLGLSPEDMVALSQQNGGDQQQAGGHVAETSGPVDKFLIGAGRTFVESGRGVQQLFTGDEKDDEIARREVNEKELFAKLDDQGIGAEDFGQLAPDVLAFLGTGGLTSLVARGAVLGGIQPTTEGSDGSSRAYKSLATGLLSAAGPGVAKGASKIFSMAKGAGPGMVRSVKDMFSKGDNIPGQLANIVGQADDLFLRNTNPQIQKLGQIALKRASELVQRLNDKGKDGFVGAAVNNALGKSVRQSGSGNVLDMAQFNRELMRLGDGTIKKDLGPTYGKRLVELRNLFTEMGKLGSVSPKQAQAIAGSMLTKKEARTLAKAIGVAKTPKAKLGLISKLTQASLATMGAETGLQVDGQ